MACITKRRGRYVLDFYDHTGIRRRVSMPQGSTKEAAKEKLRTYEDQISRGVFIPEKKIPHFSEVALDWLEYKKPKLRETTWEVYEGHVRNHFAGFNDLKINLITTAKVEKYISGHQVSGTNIGTIRKILVTLGQIFSYAVRHRYMDFNPLKDAERPRDPGEGKEEIRILNSDQISTFLSKVEHPKYAVLFLVAITTGLRQGEILGLKWSDICFSKNQLHVQRTFNKGRFFITKTKNSNRKVDLGPLVAGELLKWKIACPPNEIDLIFPNEEGKPINYNNMVNRHFRPALLAMFARKLNNGSGSVRVGDDVVGLRCRDHGFKVGETVVISGTKHYDGEAVILVDSTDDQIHIKAPHVSEKMGASAVVYRKKDAGIFSQITNFRFHDLRHTYASLLIAQGENIKYIQKQLGHSSPMVTLNVYTHLMEECNQAAACRLENRIFGNRSQNGHNNEKGASSEKLTP
ncbi:MAG: tyrosine-type recombinase/integrase [Desulfobacteraceae bacterium]|nr:tyrosine-type recombinase/integrase [Desulfobacteraceae bacterium]